MASLTDLSNAIQTRITAAANAPGATLVQEDAGNVPVQIEKQLGGVGLMALLGTPQFTNDDPLAALINARIKVQILVMEVPAIWRANASRVHGPDWGRQIAAALQALRVPGFQDLRVLSGGPADPPKDADAVNLYRLELETMQIFSAT
jgi:hypothetical protein